MAEMSGWASDIIGLRKVENVVGVRIGRVEASLGL